VAENQDGMEKSERPSSKRLEQAREKGQVPSTKEFGPVVVLFGAMGMIALGAPAAWKNLQQHSQHWFELAGTLTVTPNTVYNLMLNVVQVGFIPLLPFALGLGVLGVLAMLVQTGPMWVQEGLQPKLSKLNPLNGLKRMVSLRGVVELFKSLLKLGLLAGITFLVIRDRIPEIVSLPTLEIPQAIEVAGNVAFFLVLWIGLALLALSLADFGYQKWQFMRDQRMTKQEVKDELKDTEGNPLIRSRRLSLQRERASRLLKNPFGTGATQHSGRSVTASKQPAGWSKRPSSAAAASEEARGRILWSVRRASKRRENKAGGPFGHAQGMLFQHPAGQRMMQAVPKADVVITNPTHIAVALKYEPDKSDAPSVVAKGAGFLAERIKEIARHVGIPIIENKSLARGLFKLVEVGKHIPTNLYKAVAEVLAYVYRLKQEREGTTG